MTPRQRYKLLIRSLWEDGTNTTAIAEAIGLPEQAVCDVIESEFFGGR
ncbi:hypothetical protein FB480_103437 [Agrobacterium vitis]|nr:hypothetical protein FB480_103437 [Agrobacterium vitis]